MHSGPELGKALKEAMRLKGVLQKDVAAEFRVSQPSVSEWVKLGRIDKAHINHLVSYFRDVVGPDHWGLPAESGSFSAEALELAAIYDRGSERDRKLIRALVLASESPPELPDDPTAFDGAPSGAPTPTPNPAR